MDVVTVSPKFQVVIPRKVRIALGLKAGARVQVIPHHGRIELVPVRAAAEMRGFLGKGETKIERSGSRL